MLGPAARGTLPQLQIYLLYISTIRGNENINLLIISINGTVESLNSGNINSE